MSMRDDHLECLRCSKQLIAYEIWKAATAEERRTFKAQGKARGVRRDLCAACYQYLRSHGLLARYTPETRAAGQEARGTHCVRCGHPAVLVGQLCRDCADVTYDLQEREVWIA